ncbi:MAG: DUF523 and DUF1722 domain-containing protein [Anaerolineae bacterium]|nr:DUF523 and DUF1722 domain-containing protein [Anaerolineae bacterium]
MGDPVQCAGEPTIRLGISTCLLGEAVRYDGGHKLDRFLVNTLGPFVEWTPVCPEVETGMPIPRESLRLVGDPVAPRLVTRKSGQDYTEHMQTWARERLEELAAAKLDGFIFKKDSPSSGLFRVRVYDEHGMPQRVGTGIFAREVVRRFPLLPVEEEGRLHDAGLRENFIERIFVYHCWQCLADDDPTPGRIVRFHTAHKLTMMAHSPQHYQEMGRLVAQAGTMAWEKLTSSYGQLLMEGLQVLGTPGKHVNVMQHLLGFVKDVLPGEDKAELLGLIEDYRRGLVPLIVPVTLLKHHLRQHETPEWVHQQVYLNPYPKELMLRNHV